MPINKRHNPELAAKWHREKHRVVSLSRYQDQVGDRRTGWWEGACSKNAHGYAILLLRDLDTSEDE